MIENYICIEGNLGAGKTTLANQLSEKLNATLVLESFLNNPFLEDLYANIPSSKLPAELFFLTERIDQITSINKDNKKLVVSDYHIEKTKLFAQVNLEQNEKLLFDRIFNHSINQLPTPDVLIFIEQNADEAFQHITQRGRAIETNVSLQYLQQLDTQYQNYLADIDSSILLLKISAQELRTDFEKSVIMIHDFLTLNHIL